MTSKTKTKFKARKSQPSRTDVAVGPAAAIAAPKIVGARSRLPIAVAAEPGDNAHEVGLCCRDGLGHGTLLPDSVTHTLMVCRGGEVTAITQRRYSISD